MVAVSAAKEQSATRSNLLTALVLLALVAFAILYVVVNDVYMKAIAPLFPQPSTTLWGVVSRANLLIVGGLVALWRPRLLGLQIGKTWQHWRMLLVILCVNCGIVAGYLWLTGATPFSGNDMFVTEVITVPIIEELIWRGVVFTALLVVFRRFRSESASHHLAVWSSGLVFGLLHATNVLYGVPLAFAMPQALSAMIWGVLYGYARSRTESLYPPILLHAAMNLVVVLF